MYYIEWRGFGLLGILPPVLGLVAFGFLIEGHTAKAAALWAGLTMAATGVTLTVAGRYLNRGGNRHALYGLPLWVWGVVFAALGLGLTAWIGYLVSLSGWKD